MKYARILVYIYNMHTLHIVNCNNRIAHDKHACVHYTRIHDYNIEIRTLFMYTSLLRAWIDLSPALLYVCTSFHVQFRNDFRVHAIITYGIYTRSAYGPVQTYVTLLGDFQHVVGLCI